MTYHPSTADDLDAIRFFDKDPGWDKAVEASEAEWAAAAPVEAEEAVAAPVALAVRHECIYRNDSGAGHIHTVGTGKPKRSKCIGCGGRIAVRRGRWFVVQWDGQQLARDAVAVFTRHAAAERRAVTLSAAPGAPRGGYVVRWEEVAAPVEAEAAEEA